MPAAIRSFLAVLTAALVVAAGLGTAPAQARTTGAANPAPRAHLAGDTAARPAIDSARMARKVRHKKQARPGVWQQRTLYYYEATPAAWHWSLSTAVAKWNSSGAHIRFVRVANRAKARLVISYGNIGARAGEATIGPTRHAWVKLSSYYRGVDPESAVNRVEVMNVFAHELGHVLGFRHTTTRCSLMSPVLDIVGCGTIDLARPGYYRCRTINQPLVARLARTYGGRARVPAGQWCLIDPVPPSLQQVRVTPAPSPGSALTISWAAPSSTPPGSTVQIRSWAAQTCATPPASVSVASVPASAGIAQEAPAGAPEQCVSVSLVNRYGVGRAPVVQQVPGYADTAPSSTSG